MVENDEACEDCKEKFENDELPKCNCGKLKTRYTCDCREEGSKKELPLLPHQKGGMVLFYETQINSLQEQLNEAEWTIVMEREEIAKFQEKSEEWGKRQKQELLDKIKQQEAEIIKLTQKIEQLKTLIPQELVNKLNACEAENEKLKNQLEQLQQNGQLTTQIEVKETKRWSWLKIKK